MVDLFALATANLPSLEQRCAHLRSTIDPDKVAGFDSFGGLVSVRGQVSINMRQSAILNLLRLGKHLNLYELAEQRSKRTGAPLDQILREFLGEYYERRMAFDSQFDGSSFRYGALNVGCAGVTKFGDFCIVLGPVRIQALAQLAYLKSDSLNDYMLPGPKVNEAALRDDLARHSHKHLLALIKYCGQIGTEASEKWPLVLCSDLSYIEAIFVGDVSPSDLECVRMRVADYERYLDLTVEAARENISDGERSLATEFREIVATLNSQRIQLEVIHENA